MEAVVRARCLANFITGIQGFPWPLRPPCRHGHLGATVADAILQAGINYRTVVLPRVRRLVRRWPHSCRASGFVADLRESGPHRMLDWRDAEKPRRLLDVVQVIVKAQIETEDDLAEWLSGSGSEKLLEVRGVGPKTVDYLMRLVGLPAVAVDRHVIRFLSAAQVTCEGYQDMRQVVSYAADLLSVDRGHLDQAIWHYMSSSSTIGLGAVDACSSSPPHRRCGTRHPRVVPC